MIRTGITFRMGYNTQPLWVNSAGFFETTGGFEVDSVVATSISCGLRCEP